MKVKELFEQGYDKQCAEKYAEAIEDYNKVLELDKDFERAYVQRACCKFQLQEYESALEDFKIAMVLNPNDAVTYLNAGHTVCKLNNENTDTTYFDKAIELDSNMHEAYFMRGLTYSYADKMELAIKDYTREIYC